MSKQTKKKADLQAEGIEEVAAATDQQQSDFLDEITQDANEQAAATAEQEQQKAKEETSDKVKAKMESQGVAKNKFETSEPVRNLEGIPFLRLEKGETFQGVYIGTGKPMSTKASQGSFDVFVFIDADGNYYRSPAYETLKRIPTMFNPGEALVKITYKGEELKKGMKAGDRNSTYHNFTVEGGKLKNPLVAGTDWDADYIMLDFSNRE